MLEEGRVGPQKSEGRVKGLWKSDSIFVFALILMGIIAYFIPDEEAERQMKIQQWRERFVEGCMPRKGDITTVEWISGSLVCKRITTSPRYGKTFPHAEVRIATIEE